MEHNDSSAVRSVLKKVEAFAHKSHLPKLMLEFYAQTLFLQYERPSELLEQEDREETDEIEPVDPADLPLCSVSELHLDAEQCRSALSLLLHLSAGITPLLTAQSKKISLLMEGNRIPLEFFRHAGSASIREIEQFAEKEDLDAGVLFFLLRSAVRIFLKPKIDLAARGKNLSAWHGGYCPACGSLPHFSYLSQNYGKRILSCSFCSRRWSVDRIWCPFCGNLDRESLRIVTFEQEPGIRVDICEKCRRYQKVMDLREMESSGFSWLDDLGTLHLDLRMQEEGFVRPVPVPA